LVYSRIFKYLISNNLARGMSVANRPQKHYKALLSPAKLPQSPGARRLSLERGEYYANPQNSFWKIVAGRLPQPPADYAARVRALIEQRIALWDALAAVHSKL
jgi:hypothetical protein